MSTQDTVVALQALSLYAQSVSKDPTDITIQVRPTTNLCLKIKDELILFRYFFSIVSTLPLFGPFC